MKEINELDVPDDLYYTEDHEWVRVKGENVTIGVSDYAQDQLGDIVFVEMPASGEQFKKGDEVTSKIPRACCFGGTRFIRGHVVKIIGPCSSDYIEGNLISFGYKPAEHFFIYKVGYTCFRCKREKHILCHAGELKKIH